MDYATTKKMDEFLGKLQAASDFLNEMDTHSKWKRGEVALWGMLDDLGTAMMNEVKWDQKFMAEQEAIEF